MADQYKIKSISRGFQTTWDSEGISFISEADALTVIVDQFSNGLINIPFTLAFADYAGLETEWEAGAATTVLAAAIQAKINADGFPAISGITSDQRALVGTQYTEA